MTKYTIVLAIALTALLFANPLMASNSIQSSTEKGFTESGVRGYFAGSMVLTPDVEQSVGQSRENGGSQQASNSAQLGYGVDTDSSIEKSRENGMRW
jgi:hypothetical protein